MLARMPDVNAAKLSRCIQLVAHIVSKRDALVRARRLETPLSANLPPKTEKLFGSAKFFRSTRLQNAGAMWLLYGAAPVKPQLFGVRTASEIA
jgi:hypothetical protein